VERGRVRFGANVTAYPAAILRAKEKQAKAARIAREEPEPDDGAPPAAPAKKKLPGNFKA
jgi:hypothetical protein